MRILRWLTYIRKGMQAKVNLNRNTLRTWWFLSQFEERWMLVYYHHVIREISEVCRTMGLVPDNTALIQGLIRNLFSEKALDCIRGVNLDHTPTRDIMLLLYISGDISKAKMIERTPWASQRDIKRNVSKPRNPLQYTRARRLLNDYVEILQHANFTKDLL